MRYVNGCMNCFCFCRRDCENVSNKLKTANIASLAYHAGLSDEERHSVQERWLRGNNCKVLYKYYI